jgi:hypothetical protein
VQQTSAVPDHLILVRRLNFQMCGSKRAFYDENSRA